MCSARSIESKVKIAEDRLEVASKTLHRLQAQDESYTLEYFSSQWERQKQCQLTAMADDAAGTQERMEQCLLELLELQEEVKHAQYVKFNLMILIKHSIV